MDDNYSLVSKFNNKRNSCAIIEHPSSQCAIHLLEEKSVLQISNVEERRPESDKRIIRDVKFADVISKKVQIEKSSEIEIAVNLPSANNVSNTNQKVINEKVKEKAVSYEAVLSKNSKKQNLKEDSSQPRKKRCCWMQHPELIDKKCTKHLNDDYSIREYFEMQRKLRQQPVKQ